MDRRDRRHRSAANSGASNTEGRRAHHERPAPSGHRADRAPGGTQQRHAPARHAPASSSAEDEGTEFAPGGTEDIDLWPILWARQCERLEPLSRAMAAALRHGGARNAAMPAQECGLLVEHSTFSVNDVLLTAVSSRRKTGDRRFAIDVNSTGYWIEAVPKAPARPRVKWAHGPPPAEHDSADARPQSDLPAASSTSRPAEAGHAQLNAELDRYHGRGDATAAKSPRSSPPRGAVTGVFQKGKPQGGRGNPNRASQQKRRR